MLLWKVSVCALRHTTLLYIPPLQVNVDLTPYNNDFPGLRRLKVDENRDKRLATWNTVSEYWLDGHLPPDRHLHILVKFSLIGECEQNSVG